MFKDNFKVKYNSYRIGLKIINNLYDFHSLKKIKIQF